MWAPRPSWQSLASAHREVAASKIPPEWKLPSSVTDPVSETSTQEVLSIPRTCGILSEKEIEITENYSAVTLLEHLASGRFTSVEVTTAFCKRAAIAQQLVSCLTEIFFSEALSRAKQCDDYLAKEGMTIGPLHGLPISLKDSFNITGQKSTIGYTSFTLHPPSDTTSPLVTILLSLGCVLYVKTNIPQTLMTADSHNNIFGRTLNPHNPSLTAGGSSGGEGALSALKGSILGVGTDIAGSIRIPAFCNGVVGFKPSTRRIPYGGQTVPGRAGSSFGILASAGPICRGVADAEFFMRCVLSVDCWELDEDVLPVPWRVLPPLPRHGQEEDKEKKTALRLGVLREDPKFPLLPPMQRILSSAVDILEEAGHVTIPLDELLPETVLSDALHTAMRVFSSDPDHTPFRNISASGEPMVPSIAATVTPELAEYVPTLDAVFTNNTQIKSIKSLFRSLWVQHRLDAIIMPVFQSVAPGHDKFGGPPYTVLANLLDYPSCAIPFSPASKSPDANFPREMAHIPSHDAQAQARAPARAAKAEGDGAAPAGLQIMCRNMKDEETLEITRVVAEILTAAENNPKIEVGMEAGEGGGLVERVEQLAV
ncbi:hypothetical protein LZ554_002999 [Drepanopeziza brunnea f. sp. 'monogermtubi']|nr:hypothetical protein LZ554_002999 [Drepanopeziza brunnea f. sp. 'monogermtubi']